MTTQRRLAIVTGASSGIGRAIAGELSKQHTDLYITARREARLCQVQSEINQAGGHAEIFCADMSQENFFSDLYQQACTRFERSPDIAVFSAGMGLPGTVLKSDPAKWRQLFEVNVLAVMDQLRACAQRFVDDSRDDPRVRDIVVIGSTAGRTVSAFNTVYGATKFALHSLVEGLRQEVCRHGIRVSLIEPGFVVSEFQAQAGYDMQWFSQLEQDSGPFLTPEDVARTAAFIVAQPAHVHLDDIRLRPTRQQV